MEQDDQYLLKELVMSEILIRLPARSLGRFKCVSKSWCSTINNPSFIDQHILYHHPQNHTNNINNTTNLYLLLNTGYSFARKTTIRRLSYDNLAAVQTKQPPIPTRPLAGRAGVTCCCNGLLLFSDLVRRNWLLWNLATGETKRLPTSSSPILMKKSEDILFYNVGFGFAAQSMDYKVVMMYNLLDSHPGEDSIEVEMYSLKTDSWKRIPTSPSQGFSNIDQFCPGVFSNGMLSWKASHKEGWDKIVSLDLRCEMVIITLLPSCISHPRSDNKYNYPLVYKGESFALLNYYCFKDGPLGKSFDLWVLGEYGVKESWNKLFTIGPLQGIDRVLGFWKDGKVFVEKKRFIWETNSGGDILKEMHDKELLLLDTATQETTSLQIYGLTDLFTYRETLVPLN